MTVAPNSTTTLLISSATFYPQLLKSADELRQRIDEFRSKGQQRFTAIHALDCMHHRADGTPWSLARCSTAGMESSETALAPLSCGALRQWGPLDTWESGAANSCTLLEQALDSLSQIVELGYPCCQRRLGLDLSSEVGFWVVDSIRAVSIPDLASTPCWCVPAPPAVPNHRSASCLRRCS
eukprot:scaffold262390_cov31-Tisochrysis_lutea.AAC.1